MSTNAVTEIRINLGQLNQSIELVGSTTQSLQCNRQPPAVEVLKHHTPIKVKKIGNNYIYPQKNQCKGGSKSHSHQDLRCKSKEEPMFQLIHEDGKRPRCEIRKAKFQKFSCAVFENKKKLAAGHAIRGAVLSRGRQERDFAYKVLDAIQYNLERYANPKVQNQDGITYIILPKIKDSLSGFDRIDDKIEGIKNIRVECSEVNSSRECISVKVTFMFEGVRYVVTAPTDQKASQFYFYNVNGDVVSLHEYFSNILKEDNLD